jgi:hypothetical protein
MTYFLFRENLIFMKFREPKELAVWVRKWSITETAIYWRSIVACVAKEFKKNKSES